MSRQPLAGNPAFAEQGGMLPIHLQVGVGELGNVNRKALG